MQQLQFAMFSRPKPRLRAEAIRLEEPLAILEDPLEQLQQIYDLMLLRRKQPSANHPDPVPQIEEGVHEFTLALRMFEAGLLSKIEKTGDMLAASRARDGVRSLWVAFDRYCIETTREDADIMLMRNELEGVFEAVSEINVWLARHG